ncbi:MAG: hypothetical protein HFI93_00520 [Lachnospiraceae bacterium]|nr:hypothetical protein [Lachnospiraceae bacterium]
MDNEFIQVNTMNMVQGLAAMDIGRDYTMADWMYEKLKEQIVEFQANLPDTVDVWVQLASFGQSVLMVVDEIGFQNPDMLYFYGTVNGNEAQLIQHTSQLNFLLMTQPKSEPQVKPRRIGFCADDETKED